MCSRFIKATEQVERIAFVCFPRRRRRGRRRRMATVKSLKIKLGSCRRIVKELRSYEKEVDREAAKTQKMKDDAADPHDLKQQESVLSESRMMIPDCRKRLEAALSDLQSVLAEVEESAEGSEEIEDAKKLIKEVESIIEVPSI